MIVQCEQCSTRYRVPRDRVPEAGIKAKCKGCGHVMTIRPPAEPGEGGEAPAAAAAPPKSSWKCACGTTNPADADYCQRCKRSKLLFASIARAPAPAEPVEARPPVRAEARRSSFTIWKSLLLVAGLAVVLGVGISYALGYAVNRSITTFLTTIFK